MVLASIWTFIIAFFASYFWILSVVISLYPFVAIKYSKDMKVACREMSSNQNLRSPALNHQFNRSENSSPPKYEPPPSYNDAVINM